MAWLLQVYKIFFETASKSAIIHFLWLVMHCSSLIRKSDRLPSELNINSEKVPWRDGRVVEGAALEMLYRGDSIEGSNPSLSVFHPSSVPVY